MTKGLGAVPPSQKSLCRELKRNGYGLLKVLAKLRYSRSRYYRRLRHLGEPPADVLFMLADYTGIPRRHLLEVCSVI